VLTCWWAVAPPPGNLGDVLTPIVLKAQGVPVTWAPRDRARMIAIGSIIRAVMPFQTVWGSGAMRATDRPHPRARYLAVRGPLTRGRVLESGGTCPEVYGDPALLLPTFHDRPVPKLHDVGLVPHYVDAKDGAALGLPTVNPVTADPLATVDQIRACRAIVSSSLHGLVIAQAYGIPWAWLRFGDRLCGDDIKFRDFAASVGVELVTYRRLADVRFVLGTSPPLDRLADALRPLKERAA
jgi:hypothetical protein